MKQRQKVPIGVRLIIGFFILSIAIWIVGQGGAVIAYDTVAAFGLQELRENADPIVVLVTRGIAFADVVIHVPLFFIAIIGLWRLKFYGAVTAWLAFGVHIYWTTVAWAKYYLYIQNGVKCEPFALSLHGILVFFFLFSIWGSWYLYKNRHVLK